MYHVPSLSANLFLVSLLTQIGNIVEFWLDQFFIKDLKNDTVIFVDGFLDSKDHLYEFHDLS